MKHIFLIIAFLMLVVAGQAQTTAPKLSKDPTEFIANVKALMAPTKNEGAILVATKLEEIWGSNQMTSTQQAKVIELALRMQEKKLKARPHFENFFGALVSGITIHKLANNSLDQFLDVTEKTLINDPLPALEKFLHTSYSFLDTKVLYKSQVNSLRVLGGTFQFAYRDGSEPLEEEKPKPEPVKPTSKTKTKVPVKAKKPKAGEVVWADDPIPEKKPEKEEVQPDPFAVTFSVVVPPVIGPTLLLQNIDLFFVTGQDSIMLKETGGALMLTNNTFVGNKAKYTWSQASGEATAAFKKFSFDISKPAFQAEEVTLTYPAVLEAPVDGTFEFRSVRKKVGGDSGYPKFISNTNNARLKNIGENIEYVGGFTMAGNKISAGAKDGSLSNITVSLNGKPKFKASASTYALSDSVITSDRASILIFQGTDSLIHQGIRMKYEKPTKLLLLTRGQESQASPFYSTYHQMEVNAGMLAWKLETPLVNFSILSAKTEVPARITSREYFTEDRYEQLRGTSDYHPLTVISNYAEKQNTNSFNILEVAESTKIKESELKEAAAALAKQNFLDFNGTSGQVTLKPKAMHYLKSAKNKKDYDFITMKSQASSGKNMTLDLDKNELLVRGVDKFYFTGDSLAVFAVPDSNQVRITKNRGIKFDGAIVTTGFRFRGKKFNFNYDKFLVELTNIDTIAFTSKVKAKKGDTQKEHFLETSLGKSSGTLYLNKPNNKSGRKKFASFPMFDGTGGAFVFFNKPEILNGAYDSTVYFQIPPFKMDSLTSTSAGTTGFNGKFYSGGIFPPFETKLQVMPDQSLGFEYTVPKGGFAAYGGKGKFYNKLTMSFKGLQGSGDIEYLTAKLKSNAFTFYLDKVLTLGTLANVAEANIGKAYFMQADFSKYALEWLPKKDTMNISTITDPVKLYQNKFLYRGIAIITPSGFYGDGTVEGTDGSIKAPNIQFAKNTFKANNAVFEVKSKNPNKPALRATDVFMEYNIKDGYATFAPEKTGFASTDFPYTQFKTSLSGGKWDVNKKLVTMNEPDGKDVSKSYFVSTRPSHDNLKFNAKTAYYDISKNTLNIGGVPYIASADAHIIPDSSKVYITEKADFKTFQNATIISDTLHKYHNMYKGEIDIVSRVQFQGYANANYVNALSDTFTIKFGKFTSRNMDKGKIFSQANRQIAALRDSVAQAKVIDINTEVLPDDSTTLVAAGPTAKKGLLKKIAFPNKKKPKVAPAGEKSEEDTPDLIASTEPVIAAKKSRKFGLGKKKEATTPENEDFLTDSAGVALNTDVDGKKSKRKSKKNEGTLEEAFDPNLPHTASVANVKEADSLVIAPGVRFKGDVVMYSNRPNWDFNGQVKLAFGGRGAASDWFPYKATVNPAEVKINIEKPTAADGTPLVTGLYISTADNKIYNTFVSKKKDESDLDVFQVEGQLAYNKNKKEYKLGSKKRINAEDLEGNLLTFQDSAQISRYEGKFKLIQGSKDFTLDAAGTAHSKPAHKLYTLDALLAFNMQLPDDALEVMAATMAENTSGSMEAMTDNALMVSKLAQFIGNKDANEYGNRNGYSPLGTINKLQKTIVFNAVGMRWSDSTKAWYSKGKLSLSNILKKDINAVVPGYIEIKRGTEADIVSLYIEALPSVWYYFNLDNNLLTVASSDEKFIGAAAKKKGGIIIGENLDKVQFVNYFRKNYIKGSRPEPISATPPARSASPTGTAPAIENSKSEIADFPNGDEEPESKKKKKKGKKTEEVDMPPPPSGKAVTPAADDVVEEPKQSKKKNKKAAEEEVTPPPPSGKTETPAPAEGEEDSKKKKKSKKKKEEEQESDL